VIESKALKEIYVFPAAERDIKETLEYYRQNGGPALALQWAAAIENNLRGIAAFPASGSLRYAELLDLQDLRCRILNGFPHLIFYVESTDRIEVWRVLHAKRDIPIWLNDNK